MTKDRPKFIVKPLDNPVDMEEFKKAWEEAAKEHGMIMYSDEELDELTTSAPLNDE